MRWFRGHRRDLPWRRTTDAYAILVSEVMLQQTQVERVIPKYSEFLEGFGSFEKLAAAKLSEVLRAWSGLGYNRRAKSLWECARTVMRDGGSLPSDVSQLERLPGIGPYTAAAVASICFGKRMAAVDTNQRRVLSRALRGEHTLPLPEARRVATGALPGRNVGEWNQALMDIGARFCRARPRCEACPLRRLCRFRKRRPVQRAKRACSARAKLGVVTERSSGRYTGSSRYYRGRIVRALTRAPGLSFLRLGAKIRDDFAQAHLPWLLDLLHSLERDGLVAVDVRRARAALP